jgi:hypothetical protein
VCENLKRTMQEEVLHDTVREEQTKYQVSKFLHCCLKLLNDTEVVRNLMHLLGTCMGEEGTHIEISTPLPERDVCQVSKQNHTGRKLKIMIELRTYEVYGVM